MFTLNSSAIKRRLDIMSLGNAMECTYNVLVSSTVGGDSFSLLSHVCSKTF